MSGYADLIDAFAGLDVLVIGEAMLDTYLEGTCNRICPEAPVPVVALTARRDDPGGAANTAANARALGARVRFLSVVGADPEGDVLRRQLRSRGVEIEHVLVDPVVRTLAKNRVVAASQVLVRFDQGTTGPLDRATERDLIGRLTALYRQADAVILSDYGYGILSPRVIATLAELQRRMPRVLVADSKSLSSFRSVGVTAVKPNYQEALGLLQEAVPGSTTGRADWMAARGGAILERTGARIAAVTLDSDGAVIIERGRPSYRTYARPRPCARAAGAGDTFLATFALGLAAGAATSDAAELASAAAAVVVNQDGTAACSAQDLRDTVLADENKLVTPGRLSVALDIHRHRGRRIVFTNGCFDILHSGHITYLNQAKALGDVLVVGVNTDESIRRLKGPSRPINALEDRVQVLAALSCVDLIVPFGEETPISLIHLVRPDVFVKGGDYTRERLPEAAVVEQYGGVVHILPFVADRSTTGMIDRIRGAGGEGYESARQRGGAA